MARFGCIYERVYWVVRWLPIPIVVLQRLGELHSVLCWSFRCVYIRAEAILSDSFWRITTLQAPSCLVGMIS